MSELLEYTVAILLIEAANLVTSLNQVWSKWYDEVVVKKQVKNDAIRR